MTNFFSDVYKSEEGKKLLLNLYDRQLKKIPVPVSEQMIDTKFGKTHLVMYGNPEGKPVLGFHGGNATNPYSLYPFVKHVDMEKIKFIVPDTIGNIGYSDERKLSSRNLDYGKWAADIIDYLKMDSIPVFGGSYGGGIAIRLASYAPSRVEKLMLVIPSGIANSNIFKMLKIGIPTLAYMLNPASDDKLRKVVCKMVPKVNDAFMEMIKLSILYTKFEMEMPRNATKRELEKFTAPTYVIAEESDCLFPGKEVLERSKEIFSNLMGTKMISFGGHGAFLIQDEVHYELYDTITSFFTE